MNDAQIAAPVAKASAALGAGAGASLLSEVTKHTQSFLPVDLAGWMALFASAAALLYTLTLMFEWWWKRFWRPMLRRKGWWPNAPSLSADPSGPAPLGPL